jgi:hypothetical protein
MLPVDAICCDHMPIGLALCTMRRSGIDYFFEPPRTVAAADADIALEPDAPATVSLLDLIPGYGRLRGF